MRCSCGPGVVPASLTAMDLREILRIELKAKEVGWDALESDEWRCLEEFRKRTEKLRKAFEPHPESVEGMAMWKDLPPEEREKYSNWTARQFYALKLLIDELDEREPT
jgi:hypothetical protein